VAVPRFLAETLVLIPALNEAECIAGTVRAWRALGASRVRVIDNASTDATAVMAREAGAEVVSEPNRGYGAAAWRGLQQVPPEVSWILFSSADGSDRLSAAELIQWHHAVDEGFDLIIGDRVSPATSREHLKSVQSFGNRLCCWLIAAGWRRRFQDMGSLRLVRRAALEQLQLQDRRFGWNVEMQVRAIEHGLRIVELPVAYHARTAGRSKISGSFLGTIRAGSSIIAMMTKLWLTRQKHADQVPSAASEEAQR
jgi:glycosyltransferase involved in cell wall biosynthesis